MLAHLLVCEPPEQTFEQMIAALRASRSTTSVVTRLLVTLGLVERFGLPGERRDRYRLRPDAWSELLRQDLAFATQLKKLAIEGLATTASKSTRGRARLREMQAFYEFLEGEYAPIVARWEKRRRRRS